VPVVRNGLGLGVRSTVLGIGRGLGRSLGLLVHVVQRPAVVVEVVVVQRPVVAVELVQRHPIVLPPFLNPFFLREAHVSHGYLPAPVAHSVLALPILHATCDVLARVLVPQVLLEVAEVLGSEAL